MFPEILYSHLPELYSSSHKDTYQQLIACFQEKYQKKPQFIARAPGRVNIIGEHIDYEGYGVLPAAIEKDCLIAVATNHLDTIAIHHVDTKYPSQTIPKDPETSFEFKDNYVKYVRAGYRAGVKEINPK